MDNNQKRFVKDTLDLLNELDEGLLQLGAYPQTKSSLEQVFRIMHTIKGGANMFGFVSMGELARHFELIYNLVQQDKIPITDELLFITKNTFKRVRSLLINNAKVLLNTEYLKEDINYALHFLSKVADGRPEELGSCEQATYFIRVSATKLITKESNHPLIFIIEDLQSLGASESFCYRGDTGNILQWDVFLSTSTPQAEVESHFLFVEDHCQVNCTKLGDTNLFELVEFTRFINRDKQIPINSEELSAVVSQLMND
jgi:two-component system chemotaxis sensor kinase CheA